MDGGFGVILLDGWIWKIFGIWRQNVGWSVGWLVGDVMVGLGLHA